MSNGIQIQNIVKRFKSRTVLNEITLEFPANSISALVDVNGAGKTTLLKCIAGLLRYKGIIKVHGVNYESHQNRGQLGAYIQDVPVLYPYMTGREYLWFCKTVISNDLTKGDVDRLLKNVGLNESEAITPISGYSRGMKQRLIIAQHLMNNSEFLLFDEPTSALDPIARVEILNIIGELKQHSTILISTHDIESIIEIADHIVVIDKGKVLYSGSLDSFFDESSGYLEIQFITPPSDDVVFNVFDGIVTEDEIVRHDKVLQLTKPIVFEDTITVQKRLIEQGAYFYRFNNRKSIKSRLREIINEGRDVDFTY